MNLRCGVLAVDGRDVRREHGASSVSFDRATRSVAIITPCISGILDGGPDLSTVSVTVHDAAASLKR